MGGKKRLTNDEALLKRSEIQNCADAISNCKARLYESALNSIGHECQVDEVFSDIAEHRIGTWLEELPSVQPETCEGCKHLGKWENEVEYGYPSPCTRCKRRVEDHYER